MSQVQAQPQQWQDLIFPDKKPTFFEIEANVSLMGRLSLGIGIGLTLLTTKLAFTATPIIIATATILAIATFAYAYFNLSQTQFKEDPLWLNKAGKELWNQIINRKELGSYETISKEFSAIGITLDQVRWNLLFNKECATLPFPKFLKTHGKDAVQLLDEANQKLLFAPGKLNLKELAELENESLKDEFILCLSLASTHQTQKQKDEWQSIIKNTSPFKSALVTISQTLFKISLADIVALRKDRIIPNDYEDFFRNECGLNFEYLAELLTQNPAIRDQIIDSFLSGLKTGFHYVVDTQAQHETILKIDEKDRLNRLLRHAKELDYSTFRYRHMERDERLDYNVKAFLDQYGKLTFTPQGQQGAAVEPQESLQACLRSKLIATVCLNGEENYSNDIRAFNIGDADIAVPLREELKKCKSFDWRSLKDYGWPLLREVVKDKACKEQLQQAFLARPNIPKVDQDDYLKVFDIKPEDFEKQKLADAKQLPFSKFKDKYVQSPFEITYVFRVVSEPLQKSLIKEIKQKLEEGNTTLPALLELYHGDMRDLGLDEGHIADEIKESVQNKLSTLPLSSLETLYGQWCMSHFCRDEKFKTALQQAYGQSNAAELAQLLNKWK